MKISTIRKSPAIRYFAIIAEREARRIIVLPDLFVCNGCGWHPLETPFLEAIKKQMMHLPRNSVAISYCQICKPLATLSLLAVSLRSRERTVGTEVPEPKLGDSRQISRGQLMYCSQCGYNLNIYCMEESTVIIFICIVILCSFSEHTFCVQIPVLIHLSETQEITQIIIYSTVKV